MNSSTHKKTPPLPVIMTGVALLGGALFVLGRSTAPNPPANFGTNQAATRGEEHNGEANEHSESDHAKEEAGHDEHGAGEAILFPPAALKSAGVQIAPIAFSPQVSGVPFNGQIEASPDKVARVASVVPGRISRLYVVIGQRVQRGQILALVESRGVGEAQSAYAQATARLKNAHSSYEVTLQQAKAGVFSRGPLETARRAQAEAKAEVRAQASAVRQARVALDNVSRLANAGSFARPALEAARGQYAAVLESSKSAQAALDNASVAVVSAQSELARRRQIAQGGGYGSRPVEAARRVFASAQAARATAQSEVATSRSNLARAKSLALEGLVSTRDLEAAQTALDTATARQQSASADETAAAQELEREQKLATSGVANSAEVGEAQARLSVAQADQKTRRAEVERTRASLRLANVALNRERAVLNGGVANRREFSQARTNLDTAQNALELARQRLALSDAALQRETRIFRQNLNDTAQVQNARAALVSAQSDLEAARSALSLLKSAPGGSAVVPLRSPLAGLVQTRDVAQGEVIEADRNVMTVMDLSQVHVDMNVPERDLAKVRIGAPVSIQVDAVPGRVFSGQIELIHPELDPKTRSVEAHAEIPNPGILRPGMFARGTIGTGTSQRIIRVPTEAVQDMEGKKVVFVTGEKAGEFEAREVETGATSAGQIHILNGLKVGERAVVKGAFMVKAQAMKAELGHEH